MSITTNWLKKGAAKQLSYSINFIPFSFSFLPAIWHTGTRKKKNKNAFSILSVLKIFLMFYFFFFFFPKFCDLLDYACAPEILASKKHTTFFPATTNVNNAADKSFWVSATPITYRTTVCSVMFQESIWGLKHLANSSDVWKVKVSLELHFITPLTQFVMALT